jgi:spore coat polysaccharide biosynthesis predicted glycosyltransferase SpsG
MHFRVDANATVGSGHLMRCLSVADALRRLGCDSCFVLSDAGAADIVAARGYGFHVLGSRYDELESETDRLHSVLSAEAATSLLVDSYFATETYMASLKRSVRLLYLDDLAAIHCPVDVLINYNSYAEGLGYERIYAGTGTELLLGCAYAPLREEFRDLPERPASSSVRRSDADRPRKPRERCSAASSRITSASPRCDPTAAATRIVTRTGPGGRRGR